MATAQYTMCATDGTLRASWQTQSRRKWKAIWGTSSARTLHIMCTMEAEADVMFLFGLHLEPFRSASSVILWSIFPASYFV